MRTWVATKLEVEAPTDSVVLYNAFNNEAFILPDHLDDLDPVSFDVVLGENGGCGAGGLDHIHPQADETFIVRSGRLKVVIHGEVHVVNERESVTIRRGAPHHFLNGHCGETEFSVIFDPPQQQRRFFANFAATTQRHASWFTARGEPHLLLMAMVLHRYRDHLYVAGLPVWLQKLVFAILSPLAHLLGYRLEIPPQR